MAFHNTYNKKNIVEEYKKRFQQILEYTMPGSNILDEEGEESVEDGNNMNPNVTGNDMNTDAGAPMGEDPNAMNNTEVGMDPNAMGGDMGMDTPEGGEDLTSSFNPQVSNDPNMMGDIEDGMDPNAMGVDTMQPNDEVVDITELTDAQEETQENIEEFDVKFTKAIKAIQNIENLINTNNEKIDAKIAEIENEIKRRNPTATEKMSNRQSVSYPYTISPEEYWKEKEKTSNYSTEDDNNGKEQEQYTITSADINSANDWKNISDSLDDDFIYNQTLNNILKF